MGFKRLVTKSLGDISYSRTWRFITQDIVVAVIDSTKVYADYSNIQIN